MMPDRPFFEDLLHAALIERGRSNQERSRARARPIDSTHVGVNRTHINFCSNNYLGLTHHPRLIQAVSKAAESHGVGTGASPLISGFTDLHSSAEMKIAWWKQIEWATLFPSGYQANHAIVQTIAGVAQTTKTGVRFLIDRLAHASIVDAVRGSPLPFRVFPHNNLDKLARLLANADPDERQVVITESIFSMDGDAAPLADLARLKSQYPFVLVLDEAHGTGVYGANGSGYANELGLSACVDLFVITFSKAMGGMGGAICASKDWCDAVCNFGRAYIYSTSLASTAAAACMAAIDVMSGEPWRQQRVRELARRVRGAIGLAGASPIVPLILGEESAAIEAAKELREKGMLVLPVRPPTVPRGTSRLRITLSCDHTDAEVEELIGAIRPMALKDR